MIQKLQTIYSFFGMIECFSLSKNGEWVMFFFLILCLVEVSARFSSAPRSTLKHTFYRSSLQISINVRYCSEYGVHLSDISRKYHGSRLEKS